MADDKMGVLIHGAGWVSTQHIKAFQSNAHTEVVAISSRRLASCQQRAEEAALGDIGLYDDYEAALVHEGVDIVCVCTPQRFHAQNAIAAAQAGKHIVIEKPVANSVEEMKRMREAVRAAGVRTVVSFVLRWNPLFQTIKAMIDDGAVGDVFYTEADYQHDIASWWTGWEEARQAKTGISAFLTGGCHAIDAIRWFAGRGQFESAMAVEVFAYSGGCRKGRSEEFDYFANQWVEGKPLEYDDLEVAMVKFDNGVLGKVSVNYGCVMPYTFPLEVFGNRGTIRDNRIWSHKYPGQTDWVELPTIMPDSADVTHHPFQGQMDHFVECVREGRESHCNLDDGIATCEIAFAAQRCYESRQPVSLPLT